MRLMIAAVGKLKDSGERELFERYVKRIEQGGRGVSLGPLTVVELPESRAGDAPARKADEALRLLKAAGNADWIAVLDERGENPASAAFAQRLGAIRDGGVSSAAFLIGGPDGHGPEALAAAKIKLSLGAMTLPHGLARVILAEQLYRACTILSGHPYHRA